MVRKLFGILCDWVGICGFCSYTTIIISIWRTLFDKLQNFFQKQFTTKQRVHNLCVTFVILKWFFTLYGSSTHDEYIYILYRVLNRVLKIVTLFNRIDMFKRINVNAEKKNERKNLLKLSRAKHHRLNVCDWSKGSFKKNMHSRIWQNNNNIEQCTHHCLLLKMP